MSWKFLHIISIVIAIICSLIAVKCGAEGDMERMFYCIVGIILCGLGCLYCFKQRMKEKEAEMLNNINNQIQSEVGDSLNRTIGESNEPKEELKKVNKILKEISEPKPKKVYSVQDRLNAIKRGKIKNKNIFIKDKSIEKRLNSI